jgi:hypothetical protein
MIVFSMLRDQMAMLPSSCVNPRKSLLTGAFLLVNFQVLCYLQGASYRPATNRPKMENFLDPIYLKHVVITLGVLMIGSMTASGTVRLLELFDHIYKH